MQAWAQILFVTYCTTFEMVLPIFGVSWLSAVILVVYYILLFLIIWSYLRSAFADPGVVDTELVDCSLFGRV